MADEAVRVGREMPAIDAAGGQQGQQFGVSCQTAGAGDGPQAGNEARIADIVRRMAGPPRDIGISQHERNDRYCGIDGALE